MAEIGIIWVAVALRQLRRWVIGRRPAHHVKLGGVSVEEIRDRVYAETVHAIVEEMHTGDLPVIGDGDEYGTNALETWWEAPAFDVRGEATPILAQLREPDPIDLEWVRFNTAAWRTVDSDQLVGATP